MSAAISANELTVRYGDFVAIDSATFEIAPGAFVAMLGPNGAGKSTLLRAVLGLTHTSAGSLSLFGHAPGKQPRGTTAFVPQSIDATDTFPATALDLVVTGIRGAGPFRIRSADRDAATEALARVGLADKVNRPLGDLSGGERQRVYLARCFVKRPKLLLLDEPASNLDIAAAANLYHLLDDFQKDSGATILMTTHDWEGARVHAKEVLLIEDGRVTLGSPDELASDKRLLETFGHVGHVAKTHGKHRHD